MLRHLLNYTIHHETCEVMRVGNLRGLLVVAFGGRDVAVGLKDGLLRGLVPGCLRVMSTGPSHVKSLLYKSYGEPGEVLELSSNCLSTPADDQVVVKWLYAPVNPADINTIQGKYPSKPPLPAVPGNEGVGEIVAIGSRVEGCFNLGDKIVPNGVNHGTWRTHALYKPQDLYKVHSDLDVITASILNVNPCTAYRMLKDFVTLKCGDTVIQNGANSAVGQMVIQLCREWGLRSVNIVRSKPDTPEIKELLCNLGANVVLTEDELRTTDIFKSKTLPRPMLALNCICGKNALEVQRHLDHGGVMVTYGAMSREPLTIPASSLIFKDINFKGFWMTRWTNNNSNSEERHKMFDELQRLFIAKKLKPPPYKLIPFCNYKEAVTNALKPSGQTSGKNLKYILDLTQGV